MLLAAGLGSLRPRRAPQQRQRRERRSQAGRLLQADGSRHRWRGPEGPSFTLIVRTVVQAVGMPHALYVARQGSVQRRPGARWTLEEELAGGPLPTQVTRLDKITCQ
jgi:hypothetical protein